MNGMSDPCAGFRDVLMDYVDGTLPPAAVDAAKTHERSCEACAGLVRDIRAQAALLSRLARPAPPADLGFRIERALGPQRSHPALPRRRAWMAAAAAALLAAIGFMAAPRAPRAERSVRVVDVELPDDRGSFLGRISPNAENPTASLLDPLVNE